MIDLEVKSLPFSRVLALVGHQLSLDDFAELLHGECACALRTLFWGTDYPLKLAEMFHS